MLEMKLRVSINGYSLDFEDIHGHSDKDFDFCRDRGCGMKLNVEGSGHFDGIYELEEGYHNNRECLINTY